MHFSSLLSIITSSPYFSALNFIIALGGIVLAVFFHLRSIKKRDAVYAIRTNNIIEDFSSKMAGLTINYKTDTVKNLSITKIAFWNRRRETIKKKVTSRKGTNLGLLSNQIRKF